MTYSQGKKDGIEDAQNGNGPRILRGTPVQYRNGYSDGYFIGSRQEKVW